VKIERQRLRPRLNTQRVPGLTGQVKVEVEKIVEMEKRKVKIEKPT